MLWTQLDSGPDGFNVVYFKGDWYIAAFISIGVFKVLRSTDGGKTWAAVVTLTSGAAGAPAGMAHDGTTLVIMERGGVARTTTDGTTWTPVSTGIGATKYRTDLCYTELGGTKTFVSVGTNEIWISADSGANWTKQLTVAGVTFNSVADDPATGDLVAVGDLGTVYTSVADGLVWTNRLTIIPTGGGQLPDVDGNTLHLWGLSEAAADDEAIDYVAGEEELQAPSEPGVGTSPSGGSRTFDGTQNFWGTTAGADEASLLGDHTVDIQFYWDDSAAARDHCLLSYFAAGEAEADNALVHLTINSSGNLVALWEHGALGDNETATFGDYTFVRGQWYNISVTHLSSTTDTVELWVEGVSEQTVSGLTPPSSSSGIQTWIIGDGAFGGTDFQGEIGFVRISDKIRSEAEIIATVNRTTLGDDDGAVINEVAFGDSKFVCCTEGGEVYYSTTIGVTWTLGTLPGGAHPFLNALHWTAAENWKMFRSDGPVNLVSTDGITWTAGEDTDYSSLVVGDVADDGAGFWMVTGDVTYSTSYLIHRYDFEERTGPFLDRVGSKDGTRVGDWGRVPARVGYGASPLSRQYAWIDWGVFPDFYSTANFTISAWYRQTADFVELIWLGCRTGVAATSSISLEVYTDGSAAYPRFYASNGSTIPYNSNIPQTKDGEFHHLVAVRSGTTISLYYDGVFKTSYTCAATLHVPADPQLHTGRYRLDAQWGQFKSQEQVLDSLLIYNTAFDAGEVAALYNEHTAASIAVTSNIPIQLVDVPLAFTASSAQGTVAKADVDLYDKDDTQIYTGATDTFVAAWQGSTATDIAGDVDFSLVRAAGDLFETYDYELRLRGTDSGGNTLDTVFAVSTETLAAVGDSGFEAVSAWRQAGDNPADAGLVAPGAFWSPVDGAQVASPSGTTASNIGQEVSVQQQIGVGTSGLDTFNGTLVREFSTQVIDLSTVVVRKDGGGYGVGTVIAQALPDGRLQSASLNDMGSIDVFSGDVTFIENGAEPAVGTGETCDVDYVRRSATFAARWLSRELIRPDLYVFLKFYRKLEVPASPAIPAGSSWVFSVLHNENPLWSRTFSPGDEGTVEDGIVVQPTTLPLTGGVSQRLLVSSKFDSGRADTVLFDDDTASAEQFRAWGIIHHEAFDTDLHVEYDGGAVTVEGFVSWGDAVQLPASTPVVIVEAHHNVMQPDYTGFPATLTGDGSSLAAPTGKLPSEPFFDPLGGWQGGDYGSVGVPPSAGAFTGPGPSWIGGGAVSSWEPPILYSGEPGELFPDPDPYYDDYVDTKVAAGYSVAYPALPAAHGWTAWIPTFVGDGPWRDAKHPGMVWGGGSPDGLAAMVTYGGSTHFFSVGLFRPGNDGDLNGWVDRTEIAFDTGGGNFDAMGDRGLVMGGYSWVEGTGRGYGVIYFDWAGLDVAKDTQHFVCDQNPDGTYNLWTVTSKNGPGSTYAWGGPSARNRGAPTIFNDPKGALYTSGNTDADYGASNKGFNWPYTLAVST